jgi:hypothetical protein
VRKGSLLSLLWCRSAASDSVAVFMASFLFGIKDKAAVLQYLRSQDKKTRWEARILSPCGIWEVRSGEIIGSSSDGSSCVDRMESFLGPFLGCEEEISYRSHHL